MLVVLLAGRKNRSAAPKRGNGFLSIVVAHQARFFSRIFHSLFFLLSPSSSSIDARCPRSAPPQASPARGERRPSCPAIPERNQPRFPLGHGRSSRLDHHYRCRSLLLLLQPRRPPLRRRPSHRFRRLLHLQQRPRPTSTSAPRSCRRREKSSRTAGRSSWTWSTTVGRRKARHGRERRKEREKKRKRDPLCSSFLSSLRSPPYSLLFAWLAGFFPREHACRVSQECLSGEKREKMEGD